MYIKPKPLDRSIYNDSFVSNPPPARNQAKDDLVAISELLTANIDAKNAYREENLDNEFFIREAEMK